MATDRNERTRFISERLKTDVNVSESLKADVNAIVHDGGTMREHHCLRYNSFGFILFNSLLRVARVLGAVHAY